MKKPTISIEERGHLRAAIQGHAAWPTYRKAEKIDASHLNTTKCFEVCAALAVDPSSVLRSAGFVTTADAIETFTALNGFDAMFIDTGTVSRAAKPRTISTCEVDTLFARWTACRSFLSSRQYAFADGIFGTIRTKQNGAATDRQAATLRSIIEKGEAAMTTPGASASSSVDPAPVAFPVSSPASTLTSASAADLLVASTALPPIPSLTAVDPALVAKLDAVAVAFGSDPAASALQQAAQEALAAASAYKAAYEAAMASPSLAVGLPVASTGYIPPSWAKQLRTMVALGRTVALVGPAGNGKTTAARKELEALGYVVFEVDCTEDTTPGDLIGRRTLEQEDGATVARYQYGPVAEAMKHPKGAVLINEYDALDPRSGMAFQSFFEAPCEGGRRRITLPESGEQLRAEGDCPVVLTMNTIGNGANRSFVGRNALDGANRDRIEIIATGYEAEAERIEAHGFTAATASWLAGWAVSVRERIERAGLRCGLSMRRLLTAAALIDRAGMSRSEAVDMAFFSRLEPNELAAVR